MLQVKKRWRCVHLTGVRYDWRIWKAVSSEAGYSKMVRSHSGSALRLRVHYSREISECLSTRLHESWYCAKLQHAREMLLALSVTLHGLDACRSSYFSRPEATERGAGFISPSTRGYCLTGVGRASALDTHEVFQVRGRCPPTSSPSSLHSNSSRPHFEDFFYYS